MYNRHKSLNTNKKSNTLKNKTDNKAKRSVPLSRHPEAHSKGRAYNSVSAVLKPASIYIPGHLSNKTVNGNTMVVRKMASGKKVWKVANKMEKACARSLKRKIKKYVHEAKESHGKGRMRYVRQAVPAAIKYTQHKFPKCQLVSQKNPTIRKIIKSTHKHTNKHTIKNETILNRLTNSISGLFF